MRDRQTRRGEFQRKAGIPGRTKQAARPQKRGQAPERRTAVQRSRAAQRSIWPSKGLRSRRVHTLTDERETRRRSVQLAFFSCPFLVSSIATLPAYRRLSPRLVSRRFPTLFPGMPEPPFRSQDAFRWCEAVSRCTFVHRVLRAPLSGEPFTFLPLPSTHAFFTLLDSRRFLSVRALAE